MKNIKVSLLHITPQEIVIEAAKQSYELEEADMSLVAKIINNYGHDSIAEHITFNFKIDGVSRAELQEHMRHRISSSTVKSTRRTLIKMLREFGKVMELPEFLLNTDMKEWKPLLDKFFVHPDFPHPQLFQIYDSWLSSTMVTINEASKYTTKQDFLKYFIPEGLRTKFVWSVNLRSLKNFLRQRMDKTSHFEIRRCAELIREEVLKTYASIFVEQIKTD